MPELTPYEAVMYLFLLRNSYLRTGAREIRIGKRTIIEKYAKGARGNKTNLQHITEKLKALEKKGCVKIGDTTRDGILYIVMLPLDVPLVKEKIQTASNPDEADYFTNTERRNEIFERDEWTCFYCGEIVTRENASLDHLVPQSKGGEHTKENLRTSCLLCNSIKSGKTYEEAAPHLLRNFQERRQKHQPA